MEEIIYMCTVVTLEFSQPVCIACAAGLINERIRERNVTGICERC